ncbi:5'/3'-nucleotidase SurE [Desulfosediminicola flagellatus]|uniref:5'/3'-nucleotidase SurE n=1 Tax=Desulfosediminicola flagellatus TaxID=2569541 RepID=UPI0010AD4513|nr:5'/3'-nucleotidase SurE [Desulfosediminicola flagellatus]
MAQILVTNDDGIDSPGLRAAVEAVLPLGEVIILAPSVQQTGTGRGLFGKKHLALEARDYSVNGTKIEAYHCDCSPAFIVRHGFRTILSNKQPDLLISGINYGENMGTNITSSGTVGAALEGASFGVPGIAISMQTDVSSHHNYTDQDWSASSYFLNLFAQSLLRSKMPDDVDLLKIDVPDSASPSTPWKLTTLARSHYYSKIIENGSINSRLGDGRVNIQFDKDNINSESDIYALAIDKVVSVTPISLDMTSRVEQQTLISMLTP